MKNLMRANLRRLFTNWYFLGGCILAFVITVYFIKNADVILGTHARGVSESHVLISIGVIAFFSVFPALFQNAEYANGVIKNKVISGHRQSEIYVAHFLTQVIAAVTMILVWLLAGLACGAQMTTGLAGFCVIMAFSMTAYASYMTFIGLRFRKLVAAVAISILTFQIAFSSMLMLGFLITTFYDTMAGKLFKVILNSLSLGRWFVYTQLCDPEYGIGMARQCLISILMAALFYGIGTFRINKRDLT